MKTATLIGATGLIGRHLLQLLSDDFEFTLVKIASRRPLLLNHPKVRIFVVDFSDPDSLKQAISGSDVVFCAIGTTQKKVKGDQEAYRKIDYDIPVTAAKISAETGVGQFLLVSSLGANSQSTNFYLSVKGEVEDSLRNIKIPSVSIFRPSLLLGKREESRPGERISQVLMGALSFLIPGKYKPIRAEKVARAMLAASRNSLSGFNIYHFQDMINLQNV